MAHRSDEERSHTQDAGIKAGVAATPYGSITNPPAGSAERHSSEGGEGHIGRGTYVVVFALLMLGLLLTYGAAQVDWVDRGMGRLGILITFLIAVAKAILVVVYFMHVRYASKLTKIFVLASLFWLLILFSLTLNDYLTRGWLPMSAGWAPPDQLRAPKPADVLGSDTPEPPARTEAPAE